MTESHLKLRGETTTKLEQGFANIALPFQQLISDQKTASMLLLACTVLALIIANSPLGAQYALLLDTEFGLVLGDNHFSMSARHWVNDGLMALFFFTLGLEIKRELLVGELREPARSIPIIAAAAGGMLNHPVALFVLPLFALVNAGVDLNIASLPDLLTQPIPLGIVSGLAVGKLLGITLATLSVLALGYGRLPGDMTRLHLPGLALLGGIGFTMSVFIAGLGFAGQPEQFLAAKTGILAGSLLAGLAGYLWLMFAVRRQPSG